MRSCPVLFDLASFREYTMFVNSAVALSPRPRTKQCLANGPSGLGGSSMADDTLLNVKQVAQYLQLKESTIYSWAQDGKIPAIKIGRTWRFRQIGRAHV